LLQELSAARQDDVRRCILARLQLDDDPRRPTLHRPVAIVQLPVKLRVIALSRLGDPGAMAAGVEATKAHIRTSRTAPGFDEVLLPGEPPGLELGVIELADGSGSLAMVLRRAYAADLVDISAQASWRAYREGA